MLRSQWKNSHTEKRVNISSHLLWVDRKNKSVKNKELSAEFILHLKRWNSILNTFQKMLYSVLKSVLVFILGRLGNKDHKLYCQLSYKELKGKFVWLSWYTLLYILPTAPLKRLQCPIKVCIILSCAMWFLNVDSCCDPTASPSKSGKFRSHSFFSLERRPNTSCHYLQP